MIIIYKCVANKHQKLKNFVLDCNKVNKEKALNKWLYFCKRIWYTCIKLLPQNYPFHILLGTIKKLGAMTKTNPIWSMPLQLQLLWQLKYILNELKKFSFHWYYLEITKSQIYSIFFFLLTNFCALYIAGVSHHFYIIDKQLKDNDDFYETYTKYFW